MRCRVYWRDEVDGAEELAGEPAVQPETCGRGQKGRWRGFIRVTSRLQHHNTTTHTRLYTSSFASGYKKTDAPSQRRTCGRVRGSNADVMICSDKRTWHPTGVSVNLTGTQVVCLHCLTLTQYELWHKRSTGLTLWPAQRHRWWNNGALIYSWSCLDFINFTLFPSLFDEEKHHLVNTTRFRTK